MTIPISTLAPVQLQLRFQLRLQLPNPQPPFNCDIADWNSSFLRVIGVIGVRISELRRAKRTAACLPACLTGQG